MLQSCTMMATAGGARKEPSCCRTRRLANDNM